jgi:class 3 adenylate cyclase
LAVSTCPACGQPNPEGARFCNACATPLSGESPARREERKVVTVVFADLVGFTARAERLDPEDVRALLSPYHERLRLELERFGGTVEKFIGDAVMALFGAPVAHEDDPERAVRAALAIRDWITEDNDDLGVRVGVNTGEALVAIDARAVEGEAMAAGDVVNTAARIQAGARVDAILVGEQTYRATAEVIDYREAEPVVATGKSEPIAAWEALHARARLGVDRPRDRKIAPRPRAVAADAARAGADHLASGSVAVLRRRRHVLGVRHAGCLAVGALRGCQSPLTDSTVDPPYDRATRRERPARPATPEPDRPAEPSRASRQW